MVSVCASVGIMGLSASVGMVGDDRGLGLASVGDVAVAIGSRSRGRSRCWCWCRGDDEVVGAHLGDDARMLGCCDAETHS